MKKIILLLVSVMFIASAPDASAQKWLKKLGKAAEEILLTPGSSSSSRSGRTSSARAVTTGVGNATITNNVPGVDITLRSVERINANTVQINMVFMNTTSKTLTLYQANRYGGFFSADGDEYSEGDLVIGSNFNHFVTIWSSGYNSCNLPSDVPVKAAIIVKNVPQKTFTFSMLKLIPAEHSGGGAEYPIEIRNLTVPEQAVQTFKGTWEKTEKNGDYGEVSAIIDINLYAKSIETMTGDICYGTISVVTSGARILYSYDITEVKSINGNVATVICNDDRNDNTFTATLTYKPETNTICFDDDLCISRK